MPDFTYVVDNGGVLFVTEAPAIDFVMQQEQKVLLSLGVQGPPGPPGPAGTLVNSSTAVTALSAYKVVSADGTGVAITDPMSIMSVDTILGITTTAAATPGMSVNFQTSGLVVNPAWSFIPDQPVFCGFGGSLTQEPPAAPISRQLGVAVAPDRVFFSLYPSYLL